MKILGLTDWLVWKKTECLYPIIKVCFPIDLATCAVKQSDGTVLDMLDTTQEIRILLGWLPTEYEGEVATIINQHQAMPTTTTATV